MRTRHKRSVPTALAWLALALVCAIALGAYSASGAPPLRYPSVATGVLGLMLGAIGCVRVVRGRVRSRWAVSRQDFAFSAVVGILCAMCTVGLPS